MMTSQRPAWNQPAIRRLADSWMRLRWSLHRTASASVKRGLDILVSGMGLLMLSPMFALLAALIKLEDGGPVLYWQLRVGRHGRIFRFPKFRSMIVNAEQVLAAIQRQNQHGEGITFKMKNDPRITRIGRFMRRFSVDELPQLWCVLAGHMSLVGPRPPLPKEVRRYSVADRRRLDVIPGLTCIWQVSGRSNIAFPMQCSMDIQYIEERSIALDVKLLAATVPAVITGKGAY